MNQLDKINYYIKLYIENSKKDMNENESLNVHITLLKEVLSYLNEDYDNAKFDIYISLKLNYYSKKYFKMIVM